MTPFETILQHYRFPERIGDNPFIPHPLQIDAINTLASLVGEGHYHGMGSGKTFIATACTLYHKIRYSHRVIAVMPPLLLKQWARWLKLISPALSVCVYAGTPAQRRALSLDVDFVLVGVQIFKKEYARFVEFFRGKPFSLIIDEPTQFMSSINSDAHDKLHDFQIGHPVLLLTGTPGTNPMHAYSMIKFVTPGTYRNRKQFEDVHVGDRDFFGHPSRWKNLDVLNENLMRNAGRILFEDMYSAAEPPLVVPFHYDLEPEHLRLYRKLAEDEVLKIEEGKIDATAVSKLTHALGQIIVNWGHFAADHSKVSNSLKVIDERLDELGESKLLVFCHYKMTAALLASRFARLCAGVINGEATAKQRERAKDRFIDEPKARLLVLQTKSGAFGLDGLQHVCNTCLFIEPTMQPDVLHQAIARLYRTGQRNRVRAYFGIADGTLQVRRFRALLKNDGVANQVIRNAHDLRQMIFGE